MKTFTYTNENVTIAVFAENKETAFEKLKKVAESDYDQFILQGQEYTLEKTINLFEAWQEDLFKQEYNAIGTGKRDYLTAYESKLKWDVLDTVISDMKKITQ